MLGVNYTQNYMYNCGMGGLCCFFPWITGSIFQRFLMEMWQVTVVYSKKTKHFVFFPIKERDTEAVEYVEIGPPIPTRAGRR